MTLLQKNIISSLEDIYEWLRQNVNTKNIENSIKVIENRNSNIEQLRGLITYYSEKGVLTPAETQILEGLKYMLNKELGKRDIDQERAAYKNSYYMKTDPWREYLKTNGTFNEEDISTSYMERQIFGSSDYNVILSRLRLQSDAVSQTLEAMRNKLVGNVGDPTIVNMSGAIDRKLEKSKEYQALLLQRDSLNEAIKAFKDSRSTERKEQQANSESRTQDIQRLAYENFDKRAKKQGSLYLRSQAIRNEYEESEEAIAEREKKAAEERKKTQALMKKLSSHVNENGIIDMLSFPLDEFYSYMQQGAFIAGKKLTVVEGNNDTRSDAEKSADREQITKQLLAVINYAQASGITRSKSNPLYTSFFGDILDAPFNTVTKSKTNEEFYKRLPAFIDKFDEGLANLTDRGFFKQETLTEIRELLGAALLGDFEAITEHYDFTPEEKGKKGKEKEDFIDLWKRIVANATGWDVKRIGNNAMDFFKQYQSMVSKNLSTAGLQGMVAAGNRDFRSVVSYTGKKNAQSADQISWDYTRRNVLRRATSIDTPLKESVSMLESISSELEKQLSIYNNLTVDLQSVGEDWSTIENAINDKYKEAKKLGIANVFDNVFSNNGNLNGNSAFNYAFGFNEERDTIGIQDVRTGKFLGTVEELRASMSKNSKELNEFLHQLDLGDLVKALGTGADVIQQLITTINVQNSILKQEQEWQLKRYLANGSAFASSAGMLGVFNNAVGTSLSSTNPQGKLIQGFIANFMEQLSRIDINNIEGNEALKNAFGVDSYTDSQREAITIAVDSVKEGDSDKQAAAMDMLFKAFKPQLEKLAKEAGLLIEAERKSAQQASTASFMQNSYFHSAEKPNTGNSLWEKSIMKSLGREDESFAELSEMMTSNALLNKSEYEPLLEKYVSRIGNEYREKLRAKLMSAKDAGSISMTNDGIDATVMGEWEKVLPKIKQIFEDASSGAKTLEEAIKDVSDALQNLGNDVEIDVGGSIEKTNKWAASMDIVKKETANLGKELKGLLEKSVSDLVTSTFNTWGDALGRGADASKALKQNFRDFGAGLASNMGAMITQAGLSMAISNIGNPAAVAAGLAIAAAGGGLSFLGGYLGADEEEEDDGDEYERLLKIKEDLSDLLKQAREDSVYYENSVRHKNALSTNQSVSMTKVNDAIITPSGDVISTHPDDYLIATKTPQTLIGGNSGTPTINFSVIDKSTGVKVTQQRSSYDADSNSIDFTAVIESKVQEVIATSKGDEAFAAREARLRGNYYVG